ncbi:MAG: phage late control D family protein [Anaerolineales bacterium]|nr:phage late control D family protein [Anaerolineales bacterium]MCB8986636.1 phage late control D family protein [Ardenticatenaceae bacterium]
MTTFTRLYDPSVTETFFVPQYKVKIAGRELPDAIVRDVVQVTYKDNVREIDSFDLTINNYDDLRGVPKYEPPAKSEYANIFDPGQEVEVWLGYFNNLTLMLTGEITTLEPNFPASGGFTLSVRGLNRLHRFRTEQHTKAWTNKTDSQIAEELGRSPVRKGKPGLGIQVETAPLDEEEEPYVLMHNQYDIVFLMERARRRNYELVLREADEEHPQRRLYFGPSQETANAPAYLLEWGKSLLSFRPTLTTANQVSEVQVLGWDRRNNRAIDKTAKWEDMYPRNSPERARVNLLAQAFGGRREVITDQPVYTPQEAERLAKNTLRDLLKGMVEASGETVGLPDLRAGRKLQIGNLGERYDGLYYVLESTHTLGEGGYKTQFKARREEGIS